MWNKLWRSLGSASGVAARSVGGALTGTRREFSRVHAGRILRGTVRADLATAVLGLPAARLCGAASAVFLRRAIRVCSGVEISFGALARTLSGRRSSSRRLKAERVEEQAERIAQILLERDIALNRLGIDGIPGSGKSTLARALAKRLGMAWKSLDYRPLGGDTQGTFGSPLLKQERTVYEHYRLFSTQDVDAFDAIVHIDEPVENSRARVRRRGRGLVLGLVLDYNKLRRVGALAFDVCEGERIVIPESPLVLKIKPTEGFRAVENVASRLGSAGHDTSDISKMSKEEMLFLLACGKRREGLKAYFLPLTHHVARVGRLTAGLRLVLRRGPLRRVASAGRGLMRGLRAG